KTVGFTSGRRFLFVDTCHAAGINGAYNSNIVQAPFDKGVVVFSAVSQEKASEERKGIDHGVFTYALLRGLDKGSAQEGEIRLWSFAAFVEQLVRRMTNEAQTPEMTATKSSNTLIARPQ